jgi:hypothetical protein
MVLRIREHGYAAPFGRKRVLTYLRVDGHRYWTQGNPLPDTTVINRAEVDEDGRPAKGPRWLREAPVQMPLEVER